MKHEPRALALLRSANPASVKPEAVRSPQAIALLEQIVTQPRTAHGRRPGRRSARHSAAARGARSRLALGGAGIGAVAAAFIAVAFSGSTAAPAFAGWSARPTVALAQQITDATRRCGLSGPVLAEARGPYTAAVFTSRSGASACVEGPGVAFVGSIGGEKAADNPIKPDQIHTAAAAGWDTERHAFVLVAGRVGAGVRSIVIHRSNHVDVIASVKNGWYLAWWPARTRATHATVTTTGGVHDVALPSLATSGPPSCGARSGTGCAGLQAGSNGPGSAGVPGPPLIGGPLATPVDRTLLLNVDNASRVLVCFHPPANPTAVMQPNGRTGPCTPAARLTRLPRRYPVQKNLLEVFPNSVWRVTLPTSTPGHGAIGFLVIAYGTPGQGQVRNELTVNW